MLRAVFVVAVLLSWSSYSHADSKPNIILIMADDVGIEGLECYGGTSYKTPNLNRMASEGMRFTRAFSQPLCTPTRIQLMTGKYNHRNWRSFGILDPQEKTFGHAISDAGYATAIIGKWQLQSYDPPDLPGAERRRGTGMHPKDAGFDEYALFHALHTEDKGSRYANPTMLEGTRGTEGQVKTYAGKYGADVWVQKILNFMDRNEGKPRFVYYPMALPHWPFQPTPNSGGWNPEFEQETDLKYSADMIEYMDVAVGKLMDGLKQRNLTDHTIVIFYSDNGTHLKVFSKFQDGRTIQGGKATPQQTGIHVPLIAHWPAKIKPSVNDEIVDASDFFPTLMDLAGAKMPEATKRDGISFAPQLFGETPDKVRQSAFFWYDPRPGWDKERFNRHVFAINKTHKLFRSGRLMRFSERVLEETEVDPLAMTDADVEAAKELRDVIDNTMRGVAEPPLVNAYGKQQPNLLYVPKDRAESNAITRQMLETGKEIVYGEKDVPEHRLWIFNPLDIAEDELRPCVFFIHGGGWGGTPEMLAAQCLYLQRRGINTVSIHFRAPKGKLTPKDTLKDARRAYRWIVQHGAEHHIDVNNLVVSGGSAGGHLSLALCTINLEGDPIVQHMPRGLVLLNPVIDLVDGWSGGQKKCKAAGIDLRSFSPAHQVHSEVPPTLVLSGTKDPLITPAMIERFKQAMTAKGNRCEAVIYPEAVHGFFNYGREGNRYFQPTMWRFEQFLASVFNSE